MQPDRVGIYRLQLLGPVRLTSPEGVDVTPRLRKARALLAILALAGGRALERDHLQSLLWSDRPHPQARDSLKKALSALREAFGSGPASPLVTDGGPVTLRPDGIDVDALGPRAADSGLCAPRLLEGHGIRDAAFAAWVERVRARLTAPPPAPPPPRAPRERILRVTVLPPDLAGTDAAAGRLATLIASGLARLLAHSGVFAVRAGGDPADADLALSMTLAHLGGEVLLETRMTTACGAHELWAWTEPLSPETTRPDDLGRLVQRMGAQISERVRLAPTLTCEREIITRDVLSAVDQLFRLSGPDIAGAEATLTRAAEVMPVSPIVGWNAYLTAFEVEKNSRRSDIVEKADRLAAHAMELDSTNPLTRALVAHVQCFVLRDLERAREILEPVTGLAGSHLMLADAIALLHYYSGDYAQAERYAALSCDLGTWSPFRFAFTTTVSMARLMRNDLDGAIAAGRRAIAQHPAAAGVIYEPTLRTLAAAQAMAGDLDAARETVGRLDRQTGQRTLDALDSPMSSPFPNVETFKTVRRSLERLYV